MIGAIIILTLGAGICLYMIISTIIELKKLNKKLNDETEFALDHLESLKYKLEDYGYTDDVKALDFAIKKLKQ